MKFDDLTPEQLAKTKACRTPEDILMLAKEEGYELTNEELEQITGGTADWFETGNYTCPNCGNQIFTQPGYVKCPECGNEFHVQPGDK